ncbi:MAG: RNA-binding cell elongation regulator Jag/EloR [Acidimicrobiia bacterium]
MEWVQTTGRTVEEAVEAALDELHVHEDDVEIEVLEEPKAGFLGRFGGSEARVRVRLKPISREKPQDRRRGKPKGGGKRSGGGRRPGGGDRKPKPPAKPAVERPEETPAMDDDAMPVDEQAEVAEDFLHGLVEAMGLEADVSSTIVDEDDVIEVDVTGDELGLLVGPKGATLASVEELTRAAVQREAGGTAARIRVDVAGYKAKRRVALAAFTQKVVEEVLETGEPRALEPMGSADRKTVHDTVNDIEGVVTSSEGEDPRRYVVIRPA